MRHQRKRVGWAGFLALTLLCLPASLLRGQSTAAGATALSAKSSTLVEPQARKWKTWVLASGSELRLPPPPPSERDA